MLYDTINQSAERDYFDQLQLSNVLTFSRLLYFLLAQFDCCVHGEVHTRKERKPITQNIYDSHMKYWVLEKLIKNNQKAF